VKYSSKGYLQSFKDVFIVLMFGGVFPDELHFLVRMQAVGVLHWVQCKIVTGKSVANCEQSKQEKHKKRIK